MLAFFLQACLAWVCLWPLLAMVVKLMSAFGMAFAFWPWLALVLAILVQVCLALGVCLWHLDCLWWRILCLPLAWLLLSGLGLPWCLPSWCRSVLLWGCASGTWTAYGGECCACLWHGFCFLALACLGACHLGAGLSCSGCASATWTAYGGECCACLWHGFCFLALACLGACHLGAGLSCSGGVPLAPGLPMVENTVLAFGMAFAFWPWLALVLAILVQVCLALGVCLCHLDCLWWRMLCLPLAWLPYLAFARPTLPLPCLLLLCGWCCCCLFAGCFVWRGGLPIQRVDGAYQRKPCELQHACQQQNWPYWFHFPFQVLSTYK